MNNFRSENRRLLLCSVFASLMPALYAPLAVYLANSEEFVFTLAHFFWIPPVCFAACALVLFLIGLPMRKARPAYCGLLTAAGLMAYLQYTFLTENTGVFNGMPYLLEDHLGHAVPDLILWLLVSAVFVFTAIRFRETAGRIFAAVSGVLSAFLAVSLAVLLLSTDRGALLPPDGFVSSRDVLDACAGENVIVIVPDMFDKTYMETILEETPELSADFPGFTWYRGTEGCYSSTKESLTAFLSDESLCAAVSGGGYSVGIYTDGRLISDELRDVSENFLREPGRIGDLPRFTRTLLRLSACTCAPDVLRPLVWLRGDEFDGLYTPLDSEESVYSVSNTGFYEALKQNGITEAESPCFRLIHLYGAHYPYVHDEFLEPITPSFSDENAIRASRGALRVISRYLRGLKSVGAYDHSLIIIMADHGYAAPGLMTDPLLMVKLPGEKSGFSVNEEALSQRDIPSLIAEWIENCN